MRPKALVGTVAVIALAATGIFVWPGLGSNGDSRTSSTDGPTFVVAPVERRNLSDEVTVRGEIRRDELQRITSGIDGRVSSVEVDDGDTIDAGDRIFSLDGRAAVAVAGEFSFFRELDVGSDGPDVLQLEEILGDQGYDVGIVDELFTEDTRAGLREWQIVHGYGGATPEPDENIVIALQGNQAGYDVGAKNTVSIELNPTVPASRPGAGEDGAPAADPAGNGGGDQDPDEQDPDEQGFGGLDPADAGPRYLRAQPAVPVIEVRASPATVGEGERATFTFTSDIPMPTDTVIDYTLDGTATGGSDGDYADSRLDGSFVFPAGRRSFDIVVRTFEDDEIERDETVIVTIGNGIITDDNENYRLGPLKEAKLTITSADEDGNEVAAITVSADQASTDEGGDLTFTFEADRVRDRDTTIHFRLGGSARNGSDFNEIDDRTVVLTSGSETVQLTITTRDDDAVEPDESVVVELNTSRKNNKYTGGRNVSASAVIEEDPNDLPEITIEGGGRVGEGESAAFTIRADQPVVEDTSINYSVGGSATPGSDYRELSGTVVMPAGNRSVSVGIETLDDDVVFRPGDMVVADWPARIGTVVVDEGEFILQGQEVLTLTEPTFTIALLLSPTERGQLEPGLAVAVELQASDAESVAGVIAEVDDTATVDEAGNETYEGVVETTEPLEAVDGAGVNVDVILEDRLDVITVPVAAVLQNGEGDDVVRVVLTDGTTRQVLVDVGLAEGAFVEIRSGLSGDELVLVET